MKCVFCSCEAEETYELGLREVPVCEAHHRSLQFSPTPESDDS